MNFTELLMHGLANDQATSIVVESDLMAPARERWYDRFGRGLGELLECRLCTATWIAIGQAALRRPLSGDDNGRESTRSALRITACLATSALAIASAGLIVTAFRSLLEDLKEAVARW